MFTEKIFTENSRSMPLFTLIQSQPLDLPLQKGLQDFGLDPSEWNLISMGEQKWIIENRVDNEFRFLGRTSDENKWEAVHLLSL